MFKDQATNRQNRLLIKGHPEAQMFKARNPAQMLAGLRKDQALSDHLPADQRYESHQVDRMSSNHQGLRVANVQKAAVRLEAQDHHGPEVQKIRVKEDIDLPLPVSISKNWKPIIL